MSPDKIITISVKELPHMKIILSAWYNFLKESFDEKKISGDEFTDLLKTPVMYDLDKDQIELMICGSEEILEEFRSKVF
ncbi:MAG: hypothetical protein K8R21_01895 [Leptospira sp.]|nr:hypothetical protein [Leptospira sp.]